MGVSGVWEQGTALRSRAGAGVAAQCQTYLHARLVRVKCAEHGVRQVPGALGRPRLAVYLAVRGLVDRHIEGV